LPIIYDHQKYGADIPELSGGNILEEFKKTGIDGLIIFPFAGIKTLEALLKDAGEPSLCQLSGEKRPTLGS